MKPIVILISVFIIGLLLKALLSDNKITYSHLGRIALSIMLLFTGSAHFYFTNGMSNMLPTLIPYRSTIVLFSGFLEIALAIGLLSRKWYKVSGKVLIAFFILALPINIYGAIYNIHPLTGTPGGPGLRYLFVRIPIQLSYILWTYFFTIYPNQK